MVSQNKLSDRLAGLQKNSTWSKSSQQNSNLPSEKLSDRIAKCQENAKYKEKKNEVQRDTGKLDKKLDLLRATESNWKNKVESKDHQSLMTSAKVILELKNQNIIEKL